MRFPQRLVPLVLAGLLTIAGCTSSEKVSATTTPTPSPADLVSGAVTAMAGVTSAHFVIAVTGTLPDLEVQSAEGDLKADGSAQGKAAIKQFGQLIEIEFIVVDKDLYLKGATGGYTKLPAALAGQVYDPTTILNADAGVSKVLTSATGSVRGDGVRRRLHDQRHRAKGGSRQPDPGDQLRRRGHLHDPKRPPRCRGP